MPKAPEPGRALFVSSVLGHKKFEERHQALLQCGYECRTVAADWCLGRRQEDMAEVPGVRRVRRRGSRFALWAGYLQELVRLRLRGERFDLVLANSLEMALLAQLVHGGATRKILDLADIHAQQTAPSWGGRLLRRLEARLGRSGWEYVVTSPWFYWSYLRDIVGTRAPAYLVENVVLPQQPSSAPAAARPAGPLHLLWNGLLRCNSSARALGALARAYPQDVHITLAGTLDWLEPALAAELLELPNVRFAGPYDDRRLAALFEPVDVIWAVDLDDGLNSLLLLPNRLYQAIHLRKPVLSVGRSATARYVEHFGIGAVCPSTDPAALMDALRRAAALRFPQGCDPVSTFSHVLRGEALRLPPLEDFSVLARAAPPARRPSHPTLRKTDDALALGS